MHRLLLVAMVAASLPAAAPLAAEARPGPVAACSAGRVSLTFDDGPSPTVTPRLVRILRERKVPATFFMVGERVAAAPRVARLVSRSGFLVANHSYRHADMTRQSKAEIRATLRATDRRLRASGARPTHLMRPPYGAIDARVRTAIASTGLLPVMWDVDPRDWEGDSSATIAARILAQLRPHESNIVLQHDGIANSPASVAAVPRVVREARRRGYCFVALDDRGRPGVPVPRADLRVGNAREGGATSAVVELDRPTARTTSVRLTTRSRSAEAGLDFVRTDVVVRFPAGTVRQAVPLRVLDDRLDERTERFEVRLGRPTGLTLGRDLGVVSVTDRDPPPAVAVVSLVVVEPVTEPAVVQVRLRLGQVSGRRVRLHVVTVPGSARPGDYEPIDRWVAIRAGVRVVSLPLTVNPDAEQEPEETFVLRVAEAVNALVPQPDGTVTIAPPPVEETASRTH